MNFKSVWYQLQNLRFSKPNGWSTYFRPFIGHKPNSFSSFHEAPHSLPSSTRFPHNFYFNGSFNSLPLTFWFWRDRPRLTKNMQELLGFFLVANDETRRNVNSLIKVAANFNTHLKKLQICAEDAKIGRSLSLWWVWASGSNQQHNQAERRRPCHWTSWVSPERQKDKGENLTTTIQV